MEGGGGGGYLTKFKDVRGNCFCVSLLRRQIHMPRHASSARAKYKRNNDKRDSHCFALLGFNDPGRSVTPSLLNRST